MTGVTEINYKMREIYSNDLKKGKNFIEQYSIGKSSRIGGRKKYASSEKRIQEKKRDWQEKRQCSDSAANAHYPSVLH